MKKKLFGALLAGVLVLSQAVVAFANPSCQLGIASPEGTHVTETNEYADVTDPEALAIIKMLNVDHAPDAEVVAALNATGEVTIDNAAFMTIFVDVEARTERCPSCGYYHVVLVVQNLPANANTGNVRGIHYSTERKIWEVVEPIRVDKNGEVEFCLLDYSPIAVYVTNAATSPETGVESSWMLFAGAAVAFAAVSFAAGKKSQK